MKNFRKVLALVLVVATLFSFTAMAGAYNDDKAVDANYDTAVDVLSAIGILNGYPDGSFKPTNTITRAEMAKMIAVLSNAGDDVSELYATACDFADAKSNWAASYIAYCAKTGIVAGRSATTFDPEGKVTGLETAKMLLVTLGLDPVKQGYVGSDWKVNVLRDAKEFGLLTGFSKGYKIDSNITREQAANMMLNALKAPMVVGYISENIVTITNKIIAEKNNIKVTNITLIDAKKAGWTVLYGNVVVSATPLAEIYKGLTVEAAYDCYGRPGYVWTYVTAKGKEVLNSFYPDIPVKTYTAAAPLAADLADELNATGDYAYRFTVAIDGTSNAISRKATGADKTAFLNTNAKTGNGVVTEVYVDDMTHDVFVVIINTYIGQVEKVSARYNNFEIAGSGLGKIANSYGFKDGQMVLYWLCNGKITVHDENTVLREVAVHGGSRLHNAVVVEPTKAYVSYAKWNKNDLSDTSVAGIIAGGEKESYAYNFQNAILKQANRQVMTDEQVKAEWNIYYDLNGYIMHWTPVTAAVNYEYGYFVEHTWNRDKVGESQGEITDNNAIVEAWNCDADMVDFDAKYNKDVKVDYNMTVEMSDNYVDGQHFDAGLLAKYTVAADGTKVFADRADFLLVKDAPALNKNNNVIIEGVLNGDDTTKYLVRTFDFAKGEYVYMAWTGFRNIDKDYLSRLNNQSKILNPDTYIQYFDENHDEVAEYVFIDAFYTTTSDMFYILGKEDYTAAWDQILTGVLGHHYQNYDVYSALVDGEKVLVCYDADEFAVADLERGLYKGMVVALGVNLTVEGGDYPLYLYAETVKPTIDNTYKKDVAFFIKNGLVGIIDTVDRGEPDYKHVKHIPAAKEGVKVIDILLNNDGSYNSVKIHENVVDTEYKTIGATWIFDMNEVHTIIREVESYLPQP